MINNGAWGDLVRGQLTIMHRIFTLMCINACDICMVANNKEARTGAKRCMAGEK